MNKIIIFYLCLIPLLYLIFYKLSELTVHLLNQSRKFKIDTSKYFHYIMAGAVVLAGLGVILLFNL
jgi:hypothetical protein